MTERPDRLQDGFDPAALTPPYLKAVYDYWNAARGAAAMPPVEAIDPLRLPRDSLPHLGLVEVEAEPLRFLTRLQGTSVVEALGIDHTGRYYDEIPGMDAQIARLEWCARERRPYMTEGTASFAPKDFQHYRLLGLPFGDAAGGVRRILFVSAFLVPPRNAWGP
ncbi:PAS domain-containing protein [Tistlia consotensis]|uniref:PAS domain-containing protein n=1 Tax=Tistlia consotensis USBA 355 TaxID=560819 RepID=A0A1Y6CR27_9PROT|nr:PAS domain-containing protein [Tistlia consotensis]SMF72615.1 PAS domain-containing protein [Tistlia consotensis USBA 355]SNS09564.1 PAS domain-containing protein [Tistlia consotensis]